MAIVEYVDNHHPPLLHPKPPRLGNPKVYKPCYEPSTKTLISPELRAEFKQQKLDEIANLKKELEEATAQAYRRGLLASEFATLSLPFPRVKPFVPPPMSINEQKAKGLIK